MSEITGGELLARCLAQEGVRLVFGLPCPEIDPFLAALDGHGMRQVPVRHESAGAHMAEGLYKTSGDVAVVLGNPGPGSANLIPGVINARHEGVPLLAITSQHRMGIVYPSPPSTFQGQDQLDVYRAAVKWGAPVFARERIPELVRAAFREMWSGRPGPVQLEIPAPVLYETGDESAIRMLPPHRYRARPQGPSPEAVADAVELLASARTPAIIAGAGVDRGEAGDALLRVAERLGCPIMSTMAGRSSVPRDHPQYVFGFGPAGDSVRREADVVLVAGSRLGNLDLPFDKYWGDPERQKLIQIDVDPRNIGVTRPVDLAIVADARLTLEALEAALDQAGVRHAPGPSLRRYREADLAWQQELRGAVEGWQGPGVHPAHAMQVIGELFGPEAIYVADGGNTSLWAHATLPPTRARSYVNILELGMLGLGVPASLGAKLGNPDREVVCVTGDGAAGFYFMELQSAAREGLDVRVVVFADGSWTMEELNERALYQRTFGTAMGTVRWDEVAAGLGCEGIRVDRIEDLEEALTRARAARGPAVVCVNTSRDANLGIPADMLTRFFEVYQGPGD
ncbi:MAG TPA: thiamine pyrophosphate-binding protein [Gammaproteobacteria bacterium]|nr:thiamine pyrophosphate-binding protein [Gammaproteobacteria bacterium]